jgi:hypothetical protein
MLRHFLKIYNYGIFTFYTRLCPIKHDMDLESCGFGTFEFREIYNGVGIKVCVVVGDARVDSFNGGTRVLDSPVF